MTLQVLVNPLECVVWLLEGSVASGKGQSCNSAHLSWRWRSCWTPLPERQHSTPYCL